MQEQFIINITFDIGACEYRFSKLLRNPPAMEIQQLATILLIIHYSIIHYWFIYIYGDRVRWICINTNEKKIVINNLVFMDDATTVCSVNLFTFTAFTEERFVSDFQRLHLSLSPGYKSPKEFNIADNAVFFLFKFVINNLIFN